MQAAYAIVQPRPQPKPMLTDFGLQPYVALVCRFNDLHPCNPRK